MTVKLNHTIVNVRDKRASADFFTELFGLPKAKPFGSYFLTVQLDNDVTLDFCDADYEVEKQHYAFLVSEQEFDAIFGRIKQRGLDYWADPRKHEQGSINRHDGGRGVYFEEPGGHFLEIITVPYGGWKK
ncbi:MAG TPA: VOC family protein [Burkholderiales bacterium]|nr:VOC family protein [Burkholderiales bacterium]